MKLSLILKKLTDIRIRNFSEVEIGFVTPDSRDVGEGGIFVAINGNRENGERYIADAVSRSASALVVSNPTPSPIYKNVIISNNTRKTLAEIAKELSGNPQRSMRLSAVTGTKGKTTVSELMSAAMRSAGIPTASFTTNGAAGALGVKYHNTTPDPSIIYPALKSALDRGMMYSVIEASSQALKDLRLYGLPFQIAVFTGLGKDHIGDFEHKSMEDYIAAKRSLFTSYGVRCAIVNSDDPYSEYIAGGVPDIIRVGASTDSEFRISGYSCDESGSRFFLNKTPMEIPLPGLFNAENAALSIVAASEFTSLPISILAPLLKDIHVDGRFVRRKIKGVNLIIDYAHNADSFTAIISLSRKLYSGRIILVFGSVGGRSYSRRRELAEVAERLAELSVLTADDPCFESPASICEELRACFSNKEKAVIIPDRRDAVIYAFMHASPGDTVLILGKGAEESMNVNGVRIPYSDIAVVDELSRIIL